ncbi:MAG: hypothetical protein ONB27_15885 [candidate division KSB1 bacterium]|nr:hypothetical protein [candidate division KSB1 bacterium]
MQIDDRSLYELEIFADRKSSACLFELFVPTQSQGGQEKLSVMLRSPKQSYDEIIALQDTLKFLIANLDFWKISVDDRLLGNIEKYWRSSIIPCQSTNRLWLWIEKYRYREIFFQLEKGVHDVRTLLMELKRIIVSASDQNLPDYLRSKILAVKSFLADKNIEFLLDHEKPASHEIFRLDYLLRVVFKNQLRQAVDLLYQLDALISIAQTIEKFHWQFPDVKESASPLLNLVELYHPLLDHPQPVSIAFESGKNMLFLTGPNMSGKTTFIKSMGIAVYLAHLGLAVPASQMTLSPFDFLITNIKTEDDIRLGYSYFFSEVKRVKSIAELVRTNQKGLIISDELFKGTNIHDAYEASKWVIQGFSRWSNSIFILSSHLAELQSEIEPIENMVCKYFEVNMRDGIPEYSYRLKDGVSTQRLGLFLLWQEGIMELLGQGTTTGIKNSHHE